APVVVLSHSRTATHSRLGSMSGAARRYSRAHLWISRTGAVCRPRQPSSTLHGPGRFRQCERHARVRLVTHGIELRFLVDLHAKHESVDAEEASPRSNARPSAR